MSKATDSKLEKLLSEPKILRGLRVGLIRRIIKTMPKVYLDFLALKSGTKTIGDIQSKLRAWTDECIAEGLPFAHSLRNLYLDFSDEVLNVLIKHDTQQSQIVQDANHRLSRVVQAMREGQKSDELAEHARKLQVTLADNHWELSVPPAREGGTTRLRMIIALIAWQAFFSFEAGELPKFCERDGCGTWFVSHRNIRKSQLYCSDYCRVTAWRERKRLVTASRESLDTV